MNDALLQSALRLHQAGRLAEASRIYADILRGNPRHFQALYLLGFIKLQDGQFDDAQRLIGEAIRLNPRSPDAHYNRGCALQGLDRPEEALGCFDAAIALNPHYDEALVNRGATLLSLKRYPEALASLDVALALKPADVEALASRGNALLPLGRIEEALASFDRALALSPGNAELWNNRGVSLMSAKRRGDALASFERAIAIAPAYEAAIINKALTLFEMQRRDEALESYARAIAARPHSVELRTARAAALSAMRKFEEAGKDYEAVLSVEPGHKYAGGNLAYCRLYSCDWRDFPQIVEMPLCAAQAGKAILNPFQALAMSRSPADLQRIARDWSADKYPLPNRQLWIGNRYRHDKIRVAYLSADFNEHAVSTLMLGVFQAHDKSRFETHAVSFTRDAGSRRRPVLMRAFDSFTDIEDRSDFEAAQALHKMEIDIAVDLMGLTGNCRPGILAFRPAPIQVNYLGFPGTMGVPYIDYIVADRTVVPEDSRGSYDEQVVYLPDTYLPNDSHRPIAETTPTRRDAGLPEEGFVFCSFNNSYKFTPDIFGIWMRLLREVPGSVLWLPHSDDAAMRNLKREAEARGIGQQRIVFASFLDNAADHLARLRLADLFLDTQPYNAHSTACDALWVGLPVLTCIGTAFAGRVAASLLRAVGLPELIVDTLSEYEALALKLARNPAMLAAIKAKLARQRETSPLFDTERFTRNLEAAYVAMWERWQRGEAPGPIG